MSERFSHKKLLNLSLGLAIAGLSTACGGELPELSPTGIPSKPVATIIPPTRLSTETPLPTLVIPTSLPEAIPTSEAPSAPTLAGLKLVQEGGKWVYKNEKGEYAGELIEYTFNGEKTKGVVLTPDVVKKLMEISNTSEAVSKGQWKIAVPLDVRGQRMLNVNTWRLNWGGGIIQTYLRIGGLNGEDIPLLSPFVEPSSLDPGGNYPNFKTSGININLPSSIGKGGDKTLTFMVRQEIAGKIPVTSRFFNLGDIIGHYSSGAGTLGGTAPENTQVMLVIVGNPTKDLDISDNFLTVTTPGGGEVMVFLGAEQ